MRAFGLILVNGLSIIRIQKKYKNHMSLIKGNYKLKKEVKPKKLSKEEELEIKFEKEATKRIGGSMVYVKKRKINWDLKD